MIYEVQRRRADFDAASRAADRAYAKARQAWDRYLDGHIVTEGMPGGLEALGAFICCGLPRPVSGDCCPECGCMPGGQVHPEVAAAIRQPPSDEPTKGATP